MTYKEVQELRPGPYVIYFHPNKPDGYGVYRKNRVGSRIKDQGLDEGLTKIIEEHTCILKVSERERELQLRDGYDINIQLYWQSLAGQIHRTIKAATKKSRKKWKKSYTEGYLSSHKFQEDTKKNYHIKVKLAQSMGKKNGKACMAIDPKTNKPVKVFENTKQASSFTNTSPEAIQLTIKRKLNKNGTRPKCAGYYWKYI